MSKGKKIILTVGIVLIILVVGFVIAAGLGVFQRPVQPDPGDICYGTNLEIIGCSYVEDTKNAQVTLKLDSGRIDGVQGIILGEIAESVAGSVKNVDLDWSAPHQQIVEFRFEKTVDGLSLDSFEGPFKFQIRPVIEGNVCVQFDSKRCKSY